QLFVQYKRMLENNTSLSGTISILNSLYDVVNQLVFLRDGEDIEKKLYQELLNDVAKLLDAPQHEQQFRAALAIPRQLNLLREEPFNSKLITLVKSRNEVAIQLMGSSLV